MTPEQFAKAWEDVAQVRVAELLGVDQGTVSKYRNGRRPIPGPVDRLTRLYAGDGTIERERDLVEV